MDPATLLQIIGMLVHLGVCQPTLAVPTTGMKRATVLVCVVTTDIPGEDASLTDRGNG